MDDARRSGEAGRSDDTGPSDDTGLLTIGELARRTGLTVRTIRFWSDLDVVPPAGRSTGGYRLYPPEAVARLDLVRTLRGLGMDLRTVRQVLERRTGLAEVAGLHVRALEAEIRLLQVRRSVLRWVARSERTPEELRIMDELARLSAQERRQVIEDFVDEVFDGVDPQGQGGGLAAAMRAMPAELPEQASSEQVDAWVELAGLVGDPAFRRRARQMATAAASPPGEEPGDASAGPAAGRGGGGAWADPALVLEHAGAALAAGIAPGSVEGRAVLDRIVAPGMRAAERARLADHLDLFTDRRVERYWQLLGVLNGRAPFAQQTPAFEWTIAALRAGRRPALRTP